MKFLCLMRIDAVILDYQMPEMNGARVAAEMRKDESATPHSHALSACLCPESALQPVEEFIAKEEPVEFLRLAVQPTVEPVAKSESRYLGISSDQGRGGITFAQDEKSAKYDGMPESAIAAGCVDLPLFASQ